MQNRFVKRDRASAQKSSCFNWVLQRPVFTEKTFQKTSEEPVFYVDVNANAFDVQNAIESIFGVKVRSVSMLSVKGKAKRFRGRLGERVDRKKAYVRLVQGQNLDLEAWSLNYGA